jgi:hypothetical protein
MQVMKSLLTVHEGALCAVILGIAFDMQRVNESHGGKFARKLHRWKTAFDDAYALWNSDWKQNIRLFLAASKHVAVLWTGAEYLYKLYAWSADIYARTRFLANIVFDAAVKADFIECDAFSTWTAKTRGNELGDAVVATDGLMLSTVFDHLQNIALVFESYVGGKVTTDRNTYRAFVEAENRFAKRLPKKVEREGRSIVRVQGGTRNAAICAPYAMVQAENTRVHGQRSVRLRIRECMGRDPRG